jgi:carbonic anhydrase/acetyltransferase-like protein (isoleucine patch superfamily)
MKAEVENRVVVGTKGVVLVKAVVENSVVVGTKAVEVEKG